MLDRSRFQQVNYQQTGDFCILASYGVAVSPFTGIDQIILYFKDYCNLFSYLEREAKEYNDYLNTKRQSPVPFDPVQLPEWAYIAYMGVYFYNLNKMSGYKGIQFLHDNSLTRLFAMAKQKVTIDFLGHIVGRESEFEQSLKDNSDNVANICLNYNDKRRGVHSVTVGYDQQGFYSYDVNVGTIQQITKSFPEWAKDQAATLGDVMFFQPI
ncbi:hypothetical protein GCM10027347_59360 [Larkinella harenae]